MRTLFQTRRPETDGFRLPTEAEWEYACRAGTSARFSLGDALDSADAGDLFSKTLDRHLWWRGNNKSPAGTKPVGVKVANPWGLHGMQGNVSEWCEDYWVTTRGPGPLVDPRGPVSGS
ncbi:MAG: formylglycine-generating enzyme family protein, partial [Pirellulales bacterium]